MDLIEALKVAGSLAEIAELRRPWVLAPAAYGAVLGTSGAAAQAAIRVEDFQASAPVVLDVRRLAEAITRMRAASAADVTAAWQGDALLLRAGATTVRWNVKAAAEAPEDLTAEESAEEPAATLPLEMVTTGVEAVAHCADPASHRMALQGIRWSVNADGVRCEATDGHRLAMATWVERASGQWAGIVPADTLRAVLAKLGRFGLSLVGEMRAYADAVDVTLGDMVVRLPLIVEAFPSLAALLQRISVLSYVEVAPADLLAALRAILPFAGDAKRSGIAGVTLDIKPDKLYLSAADAHGNSCTASLFMLRPGQPATIKVNGRYLLDALSVVRNRDVCALRITADSVTPILTLRSVVGTMAIEQAIAGVMR